ncbi:synaptotagmin-11-like isoform X1 [Mizuhopecten yessoensis]|uniref:synaptotagmin-11-like isoform X1 n=1 Tax=Mizuhopecten yessoensis TaxID=6573 RepID=UPI000B4587FA|nr:synaptotagmin-11-like isoform X1 [Mizuhopecten yessoensis]
MVERKHMIRQAAVDGSISSFGIVGIVAGTIVFIVLATIVTYKCYRRRRAQEVQSRLSSAIKKGLKESTNVKKNVSARGTPMKHKATSPITPPSQHDLGSTERMLPPSYSMQSEKESSGHVKSEVYVENEKEGKTPEKEVCMREKQIDENKIQKLGNLHFSVEYDSLKTALLVTILRAVDLPQRDPSLGGCDPYVKLQLLPDKRHKCKTRVLRKTLSPTYDETFTFYGISENQIQGITLHFVVLSFDRFSRDEIIGEVVYPLHGVDPTQKEIHLTKEINPRHLKFQMQGRGDLLVSLCYQPAANRLTVVVLKARNLPKMDITGLSGENYPYVKIYLLYNGQRIAKKKTHVKKRTLNPVFNESFLFDVPYNEGLQNISLEFLLLDWDRVTKNEVIGRLEIGARTSSQQLHHWSEVINCPRKQIAEWHKLKE